MHLRRAMPSRRRARVVLLSILAALTAPVMTAGCTLLVNAQLSDKPAGGGGSGGRGGAGGPVAASDVSSQSSGGGRGGGSSSSDGSSTVSSSGMTCPKGLADCDGTSDDGCEDLEHDPANCGACKSTCADGETCNKGRCK
jgi:hypothetical protein